MLVNVIANKALAGGKYKVITKQGDFYHTAAVKFEKAEIQFEEVPKDGKVFNRILSVAEPTQEAAAPSLPETTLPDTPAPGGEPVVKKLGVKNVEQGTAALQTPRPRNLSEYQKPWLPEESRKTQRASVVLNTIVSPAYQELIMGKNVKDSLAIYDLLVAHYLTKLDEVTKLG